MMVENFKALNSDKTYNFAYNGLKSLKLNDKAQITLVVFSKIAEFAKKTFLFYKIWLRYDFNIFGLTCKRANDHNLGWWRFIWFSNILKRAAKYLSSAIGEIWSTCVFFRRKMDEIWQLLIAYLKRKSKAKIC